MLPLLLALATSNDAVEPSPVNSDWWMNRHRAMVERAQRGHVDLVFIGDSITHAFGGEPDTGEDFHNRGADTWRTFYGDRNALNLGISGDRTQNVLWRLDHGEMDGLRPKAVVIMIGTNNVGSNTASEIAEGIRAVVERVKTKAPRSKIVLLGVFPRGNADSPERKKVTQVNEMISRFGDNRSVDYVNIETVFLDQDKEIPEEIMPDKLHPFALGYRLWAMAMEPVVARAMKVRAKVTGDPLNRAVVPVTHNRDYPLYDWMTRHKAVLEFNKSHKVDLVFLGDSIMHRFGGPPTDGTPTTGKPVWDASFGRWNAVDLGFGYDRTENVLWRIEQGELEGIGPKAVVVLIGTNNLATNSVAETRDGVLAVVQAVRRKLPRSKVLLLGVLPRGEAANDPMRVKAAALNVLLSESVPEGVEYIDDWKVFVERDGRIAKETMFDFLHPTEAGYSKLADAILPKLRDWLD